MAPARTLSPGPSSPEGNDPCRQNSRKSLGALNLHSSPSAGLRLVNRAESHLSGAHCVGQSCYTRRLTKIDSYTYFALTPMPRYEAGSAESSWPVKDGNSACMSSGIGAGLPVVNSTNTNSVSPLAMTLPSALRKNWYLRIPRARLYSAIHVLISISSSTKAGARYSILLSRANQPLFSGNLYSTIDSGCRIAASCIHCK